MGLRTVPQIDLTSILTPPHHPAEGVKKGLDPDRAEGPPLEIYRCRPMAKKVPT